MNHILALFIFVLIALDASPPKKIPNHLVKKYNMNGKASIRHAYFSDAYSSNMPIVYSKEQINRFIIQAVAKRRGYYEETDEWVFQALDRYFPKNEGKVVGVIGSVAPWYESIALAYGGNPVTVEYNTITCEDPRVRVMTVDEYKKSPLKFDVIFSISSIEHDGLGRYGDPIDPDGDLRAMQNLKAMLKDDGLMFFAVPVGADTVVWNAHRIYGKNRLPKLLSGWTVVDSFGYKKQDLIKKQRGTDTHQPVFVLKKK